MKIAIKGCPEREPFMESLKYIWNFDTTKKPEIESLLKQYKEQKKIYIVRNTSELNDFIKKFES